MLGQQSQLFYLRLIHLFGLQQLLLLQLQLFLLELQFLLLDCEIELKLFGVFFHSLSLELIFLSEQINLDLVELSQFIFEAFTLLNLILFDKLKVMSFLVFKTKSVLQLIEFTLFDLLLAQLLLIKQFGIC